MASKQVYRINSLDILDINFQMQSISDRLDAIEGRRGLPEIYSELDMKSNKIKEVASPVNLNDAAILETLQEQIVDQLSSGLDSVFGNATIIFLTLTDGTVSGGFEFRDGNNAVIHSFGVI